MPLSTRVAIGGLGVVAILAIVLNPSLTGIGFALLVIVGACSVWLLRTLYDNERNRRD
jgi:hypothetical protein